MAERDRRGVSRRMLELTCARSNFAVTTPPEADLGAS